jgi:hypothetical protein
MKIVTIVLMVLFVSFIFTAVLLVMNDFQTQYPSVNINSSSWSGKYDYSKEINTSAGVIEEKAKAIGEIENGWLQILVGVTAIPLVALESVNIILLSMNKGIVIVSGVGGDLGIPPTIIAFGVIALIVVILFSIVKFWRKEEVS